MVQTPLSATRAGELLPPQFDHKTVAPLQAAEERSGAYRPKGEGEPYVIVIPPPNITGSLHMGHALNNTIQDVLVRFQRMRGRDVLWVPGTDHAGIATQNVVEKQLRKEKLSRHDLGRDAFLERVWRWREQYGERILLQLRKLACSCDYDRARFTMDEGYSRAVVESFVRLYEAGLIYRDKRMINWCPRCHTALSDIEVESRETRGALFHIRYPVEGSREGIEIATTRPETMLGDTAVAVHPEDERYRHLVGKEVVLPLLNRRIPVVADAYVDPQFGTGALKITPAHDFNDFEVAKRHHLPSVQVIGEDGRMTKEAGPYAGLERFECRKRVIADLQGKGLLACPTEGVPYDLVLPTCQRCATVVEPLPSLQWFVRMEPLARPATESVEQGRVEFVPGRFDKVYLDWMARIRDWCCSRQIWWGHRIPAWFCENEACPPTVARTPPSACSSCGSTSLKQDEDVLDTWFSSALWPFATLGWPETTDDLRAYYPTTVLSTARDIIFLWVARMIMTGLYFMKKEPFSHVVVHPTILTKEGKRMSKSLGTGVDPLDLIETYGADALRMGLMMMMQRGQDIRFSEETIRSARFFCNKLWNAVRLVQTLGTDIPPSGGAASADLFACWILHRFEEVRVRVTEALDGFDFARAAYLLYDFVWHDWCDWYLEVAKRQDLRRHPYVLAILHRGTGEILKLLHPFMPLITQRLFSLYDDGLLCRASWPSQALHDDFRLEPDALAGAVSQVGFLRELVRSVRHLRKEAGMGERERCRVIIAAEEGEWELVASHEALISDLCSLTGIERLQGRAPLRALSASNKRWAVYLPLSGEQVMREIERLEKEVVRTERELANIERKLSQPGFEQKAPAQLVAQTKEKKLAGEAKLAELRRRKEELRAANKSDAL